MLRISVKADTCAQEEYELHSKVARMLGRQSLKHYKHWRGTREDIRREYEKNRAIGKALGLWKGGMLVGSDVLNFSS